MGYEDLWIDPEGSNDSKDNLLYSIPVIIELEGLVKIHLPCICWNIFCGWNYMRHKWKKISGQPLLKKKKHKHQARNCEICINCGLKKGRVRTISYFPVLVYFREDDILSVGIIPFKCIDDKFETIKEDMFLTEKDFEVD